jgi:multifunctional 2-oxoglutarate metabolism enzyme
MSGPTEPKIDVNSWLEDELYQQYLHDHRNVDESWKELFEADGANAAVPAGAPTAIATPPPPVPAAGPAVTAATAVLPSPVVPDFGGSGELIALRGAGARVVQNMNASLAIPLATSQRVIPVKLMEENRAILNRFRTLYGKSKISFTHLIGYAILKAIGSHPNINHAYVEMDGVPYRVARSQVNLGIAVDVAGKDGNRGLVVPNLKNAGAMDFQQFLSAYDDLVVRARTAKLTPADSQGTTLSITNPGTLGTLGSVPRLMPGQGAIIATGAIDYPAEYQGMSPEMRSMLGLSKVMMITCTYDHRIIQGAESGAFLATVQKLLQGAEGFYDAIFNALAMPHRPVRWEADRQSVLPGTTNARMVEIAKEAGVVKLINAYRVRGHLIADFDPLGSEPGFHAELQPETYGLTMWDLDREFSTGMFSALSGKTSATLREILETLQQTYCGKIGCEYMNIQHPEQKKWLQDRMEPMANHWPLPTETRLRALRRLIEAEEFEHFLQSRFIGQKRFSIEGGEAAMAIVDELLERMALVNVHEAVIGMAHRGRLNMLTNIVGKPYSQIFHAFEGIPDPTSAHGSGDVKYHLGATGVRRVSSGREIAVSIAFNPSHLEAVDPVVEGLVRPKQDRLGDTARERVIPVLIHGDAAFAGQGVVAETLNLSQLEGYTTGGTIHLVINNQIGFTTGPSEARSTPYSTDVARMVQAPIFHVNGDDPEACLRVAQLAFDYRQAFKKDVVIDMFCYRRHGHNEADDPSYTQPIMYRKIKAHQPVSRLYTERLERDKIVTGAEAERIRKDYLAMLAEAYDVAQKTQEQFELQELSAVPAEEIPQSCALTPADRGMLETIVRGITTFPESFHLHPKLRGFIEKRRDVLNGSPIDWATAETLAFGSLVLEGTPVRLSGQDSSRGTFSQRHLEYVDSENGTHYIPLQHLSASQARFDVVDSSLSEYAVMGYEFGYSVADPLTLVMWEAQFGDFANGAQIMIDQFISAAETKWGQPSGLVLLLPHGYEGQGPEHSSARIERFLQLCAENNMQVANCTTPSQYFHLLRRQMQGGHDRRGIRKPLIVFTPKSILRHAKAVSHLNDLAAGGFREVLSDTGQIDYGRVKQILLCSGKVYYDLVQARQDRAADHVALVRVEQLYPFPATDLADILARYPLPADVCWVQEEPANQGPWRFVRDNIQPLLDSSRRKLRYAGRPESASTSAGSVLRHNQEQADLIETAFTMDAMAVRKPRLVRAKRK